MMIEGPHSICPKCGHKWVKATSGESYCAPCRSAYHRVIRALKKKHSPPEDHICDICGKTEDQLKDMFGKHGIVKSKWRLDHCHISGQFRGFLCHSCNSGLGNFQDDPEVLQKAITYLNYFNGKL